MKRTAAVFLASLVIMLYAMSYTRINAEENTVTETLPSETETVTETETEAQTTQKVIDIPKPPQTTETETETETEEETTFPPGEETAEEVTETEPETSSPPDETTAPAIETTARETETETETERETVPPPETIIQETRAPRTVLREPGDIAVARITIASDPPETIKPEKVAPTVAPAQTTAAVTKKTVTTVNAEATGTVTDTDEMLTQEPEPFDATTESETDDKAQSGPTLTIQNVVVIGTGSAVVTALLFIYRFAKRP